MTIQPRHPNSTEEFDKEKVDRIIYGLGVNSWNRLEIFADHYFDLTDKEYWYGLGVAYTGSDNLFKHRDLVKELFTADRDHRDYLMNPNELNIFHALPDKTKIYRAMTVAEFDTGEFGVAY